MQRRVDGSQVYYLFTVRIKKYDQADSNASYDKCMV